PAAAGAVRDLAGAARGRSAVEQAGRAVEAFDGRRARARAMHRAVSSARARAEAGREAEVAASAIDVGAERLVLALDPTLWRLRAVEPLARVAHLARGVA